MAEDHAASQQASSQKASIEEVEEAMEPLKICPRKVLESLGHLRISRARIKPIESQAPDRGGTADVQVAILAPAQPSNSSESEEIDYVAVKKLRFDKETNDHRALAPFAYEVNILNVLSHESVVKIVGFVEDVEDGVAWMVFAWQKNGNLREFVRSANWELPERISLIDDVADGLGYLHGRNPPICHGDMKSLNILVNSEHRAVITDFGSARPIHHTLSQPTIESPGTAEMPDYPQEPPTEASVIESPKAKVAPSGEFITITGPAWTMRWAAPELLAGDSPGLASDVWALGWICWEAVTGNFPFANLQNCVAVIVRITKGDLPAVKHNDQLKQIGTLCSLMEECWRVEADKRPTASRCQQVVSLLPQALPSRKEESSLEITRSSGLLHALGLVQLSNGMIPEACKHFQQALEVSELVGDDWDKGRALNALGDASHLQSKYSRAEELFIQAGDVYSQIEDHLDLALSKLGLGDVYSKKSEYPKAEESYIQARDIYSQIGSQLGVARSVRSLGDMYRMRDECSKAEESCIQARDIYSQAGSQLGFAQSVKSLGDVHYRRSEYIEAEKCYTQCWSSARAARRFSGAWVDN